MKLISRKIQMILDQPIFYKPWVLCFEFRICTSYIYPLWIKYFRWADSWKIFENKIRKIKSKITIWQPSNKTEGKEWHNCMMDHLKFGYISEFLCCDEENSIQKFKGFWQVIDVYYCCHPHSTEKNNVFL